MTTRLRSPGTIPLLLASMLAGTFLPYVFGFAVASGDEPSAKEPAVGLTAAGDLDAAGIEFFETKIRPVLVRECYECHAADAKQVHGGLLVDHSVGLTKGGDSGPSVVPGDIDASLLISALRHESFEMPPKGRLADEVIDDFVRWIQMGAPDPRIEAVEATSQAMSLAAAAEHWSFRPVTNPALPEIRDTVWPRAELDHFVLAKLESAGLSPVRPATKREWIRRATFDLTGLPPTPAEIAEFLADDSSLAYEAVVDRLLGSPHYGERWGRHWLDVARYAEDQAHTFAVKPSTSGYRFRDWVIQSLNDDLPYDQFVKLQIAADLIDLDAADRFRHLPALGFFGLGAQYYKNTDAERARADELDDRVDTLTRGFLGLTVSCARCHDHKYDAIPTQDYYSLAGVFQSCKLDDAPLVPGDQVDAFKQAQQRSESAENATKAFVAQQTQAVAEVHANRLADYALAAWRFRQAKGTPDAIGLKEFAEEHGLAEPVLGRWVKWINDPKPAPPPVLQALTEKLRQTDEPADDWAAMAEGLQSRLRVAIDIRAGRDPNRETVAAVAQATQGDALEAAEPATTATAATTEAPAEASTLATVVRHEPGTPRYSSPLLTKLNPLAEIDLDVSGATELYLVVTDGGDGKSCDHANWAEPKWVGADGTKYLTSATWKSVQTGFGSVSLNRSVSGQPLRIGGQRFKNGLGTHAPSVIAYDLPPGVTRFQSRVGLDDGGSEQGACGDQASIQFRVYTEPPNDLDAILAGRVKPDEGVMGKDDSDLVQWALSDKGLFMVPEGELSDLIDEPLRQRWSELRDEAKVAKDSIPPAYPIAHVISDAAPTDMHVFVRGNPARKGDLAPRRFLQLLNDVAPDPFLSGSGRVELAEAIASPNNPLTPRVIVNRVWQHHFGRGLVGTPSNFGALGDSPTHPELLDHLTSRFLASGWSLKSLHRDIMLSATYRLSSDHDEAAAQVDGDNRLLWRMNRRRLDVESWRDSLLAVSGKLDRSLTGPSTELDAADNVRRTVYGKVSRHELNGLLRLFDFPDANITSEKRSETTVPQQQLFVLNSPFMVEQAKAFAEYRLSDPNRPMEEQIQEAFEVLYGRPAEDAEVRLGAAFLGLDDSQTSDTQSADSQTDAADKDTATDKDAGLSRRVRYAQVLLGANEFIFID